MYLYLYLCAVRQQSMNLTVHRVLGWWISWTTKHTRRITKTILHGKRSQIQNLGLTLSTQHLWLNFDKEKSRLLLPGTDTLFPIFLQIILWTNSLEFMKKETDLFMCFAFCLLRRLTREIRSAGFGTKCCFFLLDHFHFHSVFVVAFFPNFKSKLLLWLAFGMMISSNVGGFT
jgi:hypothetical protein